MASAEVNLKKYYNGHYGCLIFFLVFIFNNILTVTVKRRNKMVPTHFSSSSDVMTITDCSCHFVESSLLCMSPLCVQSSSVPVGLEYDRLYVFCEQL